MQRLLSLFLELLLLLVKLTHLRSSALTKVVVFGPRSLNCMLGLLLYRLNGANSFMLRCTHGCSSGGGKVHDLCWVSPNEKVLLQVGFNLRMQIVLHVLLKERGLQLRPSSLAISRAIVGRIWSVRTNVPWNQLGAILRQLHPPWHCRRWQPRWGRHSEPRIWGRWIEDNLSH